jgi:hypothetical protein
MSNEFGFCQVRFWAHPFRWVMRDPRAYWFWLAVWAVPLVVGAWVVLADTRKPVDHPAVCYDDTHEWIAHNKEECDHPSDAQRNCEPPNEMISGVC